MLNIMPDQFTFEQLLFIISTAITIILFILFLRLKQQYQKLKEREDLASFEDAKRKTSNILYRAIKRAQDILGEAKEERTEILAEYEHQLSDLSKELQKSLPEEINHALLQFQSSLTSLSTASKQAEVASEEVMKQKINEISVRFEGNLTVFLKSIEEKSIFTLEQELQNMRQLIDGYKKQQLGLVDENIIAMLERTLSLVMAKKVSLEDELDLVYEALDKAKAEKFII